MLTARVVVMLLTSTAILEGRSLKIAASLQWLTLVSRMVSNVTFTATSTAAVVTESTFGLQAVS